jgi:hypothetical protein
VSEIQNENPFFFLFPNISVFMTVYSVLMACMTASMIQTMVNFMRSMHQPESQQQLSWRAVDSRLLRGQCPVGRYCAADDSQRGIDAAALIRGG